MNLNKNRMQIKKLPCCLLACLLFILCMCPAIVYAQGDAAGGQRIFDGAGLFTDAEETKLQTLCTEKIAEGRLDIVVVTTESTGGKSAMAYADDFYDENGFGYEGNTGVLLLINMGEREIWISTTGEAESYFTGRRLDALLDTVAAALADGDYAYGARQFIEDSAAYMYSEPDEEEEESWNGNYSDGMQYAQESGSRMLTASRVLQCLMISFVIAGLFVLILYIKQRGGTQTNAHTYLKENRYELAGSQDLFTHTTTVRRQMQSSNSNSHSKSGGGGHASSGGVHHGGGGRKF